MTDPTDDALEQALARTLRNEPGAAGAPDARPSLRRRLHAEQRPGTGLYIAAQSLLLATLLAAGLWYWLH